MALWRWGNFRESERHVKIWTIWSSLWDWHFFSSLEWIAVKWEKLPKERKWLIIATTSNDWRLHLHEAMELTRTKVKKATCIIPICHEEATTRDCITSLRELRELKWWKDWFMLPIFLVEGIKREIERIIKDNNPYDYARVLSSANPPKMVFVALWAPKLDHQLYTPDIEWELKAWNLNFITHNLGARTIPFPDRKLTKKFWNHKQIWMATRLKNTRTLRK